MSMFGTAPADVYALLLDVNPERLTQAGIGPEQIEKWIDEYSQVIALECAAWHTLSTSTSAVVRVGGTTTTTETTTTVEAVPVASLLDQFRAAASAIVALAVAATVEDARHPERAAPSQSSYGTVLWTRYETSLARLTRWYETARTTRHDGVLDDTADGPMTGRVAFTFPTPYVPDTFRP